ncbi:hypothetical protein SAMD00079811_53330 [Scytonema sp. HK-05]|nr:hypothetical protein SAMD00079811_53330 [Scytonema sp. HK-05]
MVKLNKYRLGFLVFNPTLIKMISFKKLGIKLSQALTLMHGLATVLR